MVDRSTGRDSFSPGGERFLLCVLGSYPLLLSLSALQSFSPSTAPPAQCRAVPKRLSSLLQHDTNERFHLNPPPLPADR